jgi:hypothetical protein
MAGRRILAAAALSAALAACAGATRIPWTPGDFVVAEADFDRVWEASIVTIGTFFGEFANVSRAERRIESAYYYPASGLTRQKAEARIDPTPTGYVVRVRTIVERLTGGFPPRWEVRGPDLEANRLLLEAIRERAFGPPSGPPSPAQGRITERGRDVLCCTHSNPLER